MVPNGASHTGSARWSRTQPVCVYRSTDSTCSISIDIGISEEAAGVLALEGASGEKTSTKGVALVAA